VDHTDKAVSEAVILLTVSAPVKELLASRTGITQTPVLFENFNKLRSYRIGWDQAGWKPTCPVTYKAIKKYFENIRNIKCAAKNISVPDTATCEASSVGAALGIVWDINDPTTQWPPATSNLVFAPIISTVSSNVPPIISNKRKDLITTVTEEPSRNREERSRKVSKRLEDGFDSIAPLPSLLRRKEKVCIKHIQRICNV
jgi:hypothetical protein